MNRGGQSAKKRAVVAVARKLGGQGQAVCRPRGSRLQRLWCSHLPAVAYATALRAGCGQVA